jgi:hypothetical protein
MRITTTDDRWTSCPPHLKKLGKMRWNVIDRVRAIHKEGNSEVAALRMGFLDIVREDIWKEHWNPLVKAVVQFDGLSDFITAPTPEGCGMGLDEFRRLFQDHAKEQAIIEEALTPEKSEGNNKEGTNQHTPTALGRLDNVKPTRKEYPDGNSRARALRSLRKHAPAQYERVKAGEVSAHKAMVEAGLRRKTITVPADVGGLIEALNRRLSNEDILTLRDGLRQEGARA